MSDIKKAMYKQVLKGLQRKKKKTQSVVNDVLDENYEAQVDPDDLPVNGKSVVAKSKGVKKLKSFLSKKEEKKSRCWEGYEPVPEKEPYSEGSCRKK